MVIFEVFIITFILILTTLEVFLPNILRPNNLFGVTVAPDTRTRPEGRAITARWRITIAVFGFIMAGIVATIGSLFDELTALYVDIGALLIVAIGQSVIFANFHQQALAFALPTSGTTSTASLRPRPYVQMVPPWWELLPLGMIGGTIAILANLYPSAPERYPIHWDINGNPNGYADKSIGSFYFLVGTQIILWLLLTAIGPTIRASRMATTAADGANALRTALTRFIFALKSGIIAIFGAIAVITAQSAINGTEPTFAIVALPLGFAVLVIVAAALIFARYGQSGWRLSGQAPTTSDGSPDKNWKLGIFYYNPNDPALFVEVRSGIGTTFNFAKPAAWLILIALLVIAPVAIIAVTLLVGH